MYAAAERLKHGSLEGEIVERQYAVDDAPMLRLLETLNESGEPAALTALADRLSGHPMLLGHPFVWDLFRALYRFASPHDAYNAYAQDWLIKLVKAWAEGVTFGYDVVITRPSAGRGQPQQLFPHLRDRDGWWPSTEADEDRRDAEAFRWAYDDLMDRLKPYGPSRENLRDYRELREHARDTAPLVAEIAEKISRVFHRFMQDWNISREPPPEHILHNVVRAGLEVSKGRNPRHKIACGLLATLRWVNIQGLTFKLNTSLVESTLKTLRKHEINESTFKTLHKHGIKPRASGPLPQPKRIFFSGGRACVYPFFA
jgi:hypothetical protein